jgi:hypothetical protein
MVDIRTPRLGRSRSCGRRTNPSIINRLPRPGSSRYSGRMAMWWRRYPTETRFRLAGLESSPERSEPLLGQESWAGWSPGPGRFRIRLAFLVLMMAADWKRNSEVRPPLTHLRLTYDPRAPGSGTPTGQSDLWMVGYIFPPPSWRRRQWCDILGSATSHRQARALGFGVHN